MFLESVLSAKTKPERDADHELPYDPSPKPNINSALCFVICSNFAFREDKVYVRVLDMFCCWLAKRSSLLCTAVVRSLLVLRSIWYSLNIKNIPEE